MNLEKQKYREALIYVAEALDEIESYGVKEINLLPEWIQQHILQMVSVKGLTYVKDTINDLGLVETVLNKLLEKIVYWDCQGSKTD